jgi:thymidylate kinase
VRTSYGRYVIVPVPAEGRSHSVLWYPDAGGARYVRSERTLSVGRGVHLRETQDPGTAPGDPAVLEPSVAGSSDSVGSTVLGGPEPSARDAGALELVTALCEALDAERVSYCHWKSNEAIARSATGENDLDLLVSRSDAERFEAILRRLGFKDVRQPRWKQLPGIYHSYGLDPETGAFVHIHAHYQLVVGDDMTKNIHLPVEAAYLASASPDRTFRLPAPEFELAVFLIRMTVKHCTWDAFVTFQGSLSASERRELDDLLARVDIARVWTLADAHFPFISRGLWERCLRAAQPGASRWFQFGTARRLQRALSGWSRRPPAVDTWVRMWRRARTVVRRKVLRRGPVRNGLASGGVLIAVVGGDGAGKSTVVHALSRWFSSEHIDTHTVHLGKPPWSPLTAIVKSALKLVAAAKRSSTSSAKALRSSLDASDGGRMSLRDRARLGWEVLTARDRYRTYRRARRLASNGSIVLCDRYPLPQVSLMDGAVTARMKDPSRWGRWARSLAALERRYYDRIAGPDILIVLRLDPDTAVERKRGVEPESTVRPRSEEIWRMDWRGTPAVVVDAASSKERVVSEIRSVIWSRL